MRVVDPRVAEPMELEVDKKSKITFLVRPMTAGQFLHMFALQDVPNKLAGSMAALRYLAIECVVGWDLSSTFSKDLLDGMHINVLVALGERILDRYNQLKPADEKN